MLTLTAVAADKSGVLSLDSAIADVLGGNPNLKAAKSKWDAVKARVPQAAAWEDPTMQLLIERQDTLNPIKAADAEWMVSQKLPLSGKPQARTRVAEAEAAAAYQELRRVQYDLVMKTRAAFFAYASARQRLALNDENRRILSDIADIARNKVATNETRVSDGLLAETEIAMLQDKRLDIEREAIIAQAQLNTLLNQPAAKKLGDPASLVFRPLAMGYEEFARRALAHRPEVAMAQKKVETDAARIDLARREGKLDPEVFIAARQISGSGLEIREYDTGISIPLTWFNRKKYRAMVQEAEATRDSSQHELEAMRLDTLGMVRAEYQEAATAAKRYLLLRDQVLPRAKKTLDAVAAEYASRKATFLEYNNARLTYQNAQVEMFDRLAAYNTASARLQTLTSPLTSPLP